MKNKNGFTLIELLSVIIILGMISLIVFPTVNETIKNQREKLYDKQVDTIIDAAENWGIKNIDLLPEDGSAIEVIDINDLVKEGVLKNSEIKDPRNGEIMVGCVEISFDQSSSQYTYSYIDSTSANYTEKCLNF